jgi:hypothetical protein
MWDVNKIVPWVALAVSVSSVCFAGAAWWTNRQKLRLDLYSRRFDIYSRTLNFYHDLLEWKPTTLEKASTSLQDSPSREAQFLFDDDSEIHQLMERIHRDTMGIIGYQRDVAPKFIGQQDLAKFYDEFTERLNRLHDSIPLLEQRMSKYLDFHTL